MINSVEKSKKEIDNNSKENQKIINIEENINNSQVLEKEKNNLKKNKKIDEKIIKTKNKKKKCFKL